MGGLMDSGPFRVKMDLQLTASEKTGPISYEHQELNSSNNLNERGENSELQMRPRHGRPLNRSFVRHQTVRASSWAVPACAFDLYNCETINGYRLRCWIWVHCFHNNRKYKYVLCLASSIKHYWRGAGIDIVVGSSGSFLTLLPFIPLCEYATIEAGHLGVLSCFYCE